MEVRGDDAAFRLFDGPFFKEPDDVHTEGMIATRPLGDERLGNGGILDFERLSADPQVGNLFDFGKVAFHLDPTAAAQCLI